MLVALVQYYSNSSSLSTNFYKPGLWKFRALLFLVTISMFFWCDWAKLIHIEISLCFFAKSGLFFNTIAEPVTTRSRTTLWLSSKMSIKYNNCISIKLFSCWKINQLLFLVVTYNQFHNILRLFDVLPNFLFTTSETMVDYYL